MSLLESDAPSARAVDLYPTPSQVTRALLSVERFPGGIWEPCAGRGDMAAVLRAAGNTVRASTIEEGRWDKHAPKHRVEGDVDFLRQEEASHPNIVTNPPFRHAEEIVRHAIDLKPAKVAMLLNLKWLGSVGRARGIFVETPPARVHVIADRVSMFPADWDGPRGTSTETMAWFVWEWPFARRSPAIGWLIAGEFQEVAVP